MKLFEITTPIGPMVAIADESRIYLLNFSDSPKLASQLKRIEVTHHNSIVHGAHSTIINKLREELAAYFASELRQFSVPIANTGSEFQQRAWGAVAKIPYGHTISYKQQSQALGTHPRAAASANSANQLLLIIPCHRIIQNDGSIGGYSGGIQRKRFLLQREADVDARARHSEV